MKQKKKIIIIFLIILLIFLLTYSSLEYDKKNTQNTSKKFQNFEKYNNTELVFNAKIREINIVNHTISANIGDPPYTLIEIKINNFNSNFHKGDIIFVIGILDGKNHVTARTVFVNEPWNDYLEFIISIPAIPFVIYLFFRTWKFNKKTLLFERRQKNA
jgi:hypothetical protein